MRFRLIILALLGMLIALVGRSGAQVAPTPGPSAVIGGPVSGTTLNLTNASVDASGNLTAAGNVILSESGGALIGSPGTTAQAIYFACKGISSSTCGYFDASGDFIEAGGFLQVGTTSAIGLAAGDGSFAEGVSKGAIYFGGTSSSCRLDYGITVAGQLYANCSIGTGGQFNGSGAGLTSGTVPDAALVTAPVTSVGNTSPITSSGGTTPTIGCATCVTTAGGQSIAGTETFSNLTVAGGALNLTNSTSNTISFPSTATGAPTFTTGATSERIVFYPFESGTTVDYAMGMASGALWVSLPGATSSYKFSIYGGTAQNAYIDGAGDGVFAGNVTSTGGQFNGSGAGLTSGTIPDAALVSAPVTGVAVTAPITNGGTSVAPNIGCTTCVVSVGVGPSGNLVTGGTATSPTVDLKTSVTIPTLTVSTGGEFITGTASVATLAFLNATSNNITFPTAGTGAPTFTTGSASERIVFYPMEDATHVDYAMGMASGALWVSLPQATSGNKFSIYGGTSQNAYIDGLGDASFNGTVTGNLFSGSGASLTSIPWSALPYTPVQSVGAGTNTTIGGTATNPTVSISGTIGTGNGGTGTASPTCGTAGTNTSVSGSFPNSCSWSEIAAPSYAGSPTIAGGALNFTNATSNNIEFPTAGTGAPTFTTASAGERFQLYPDEGASAVDYGIGIGTHAMWLSVPTNTSTYQFQFYGGTSLNAYIDGAGNANFNGTVAMNTATLTNPLGVAYGGTGGAIGPGGSLTAATAGLNTTETILSKAALGAGSLAAGTTYTFEAFGTCTSTAANVSTFTIRFGTAGTTSDASIGTWTTTAAASGTAVPFDFRLPIIVRTIGSGTSATIYAWGVLDNTGTTGITSSASPVVAAATTSGFNSSQSSAYLDVSYKSAATTTTCTFQGAKLTLDHV